MKKERHFPWPLVWAAEWGAMLLCCALCVFVPLWVQPYSVAQGACLYGAVPLAGLACAYASVRRGVHGLLAWIPPWARCAWFTPFLWARFPPAAVAPRHFWPGCWAARLAWKKTGEKSDLYCT